MNFCAICVRTARVWNRMPQHLMSVPLLSEDILKTHLFRRCFSWLKPP